MPTVSKTQALELLTNAIQDQFAADELLEIYNEIFPDAPCSEEEARKDTGPLIERLVDHFNSGLAIEEIVDLWRLIFTRHRNVWYNEEEERIHYNEEAEAFSSE